ncbi:hypothetical protein GF342_02830 [Candidatus Woesearchaeota archaeon]|nr:hypothetical protein [Candidatus Woesearchaeota archaeon]
MVGVESEIVRLCRHIERDNKVKILFAVENGSRAWGMQSHNSDYDVRFVFVHPLERYIALRPPLAVIDHTMGLFDVVGFDVMKFLKLLAASNPTVIEWLVSDCVYVGEQPAPLRRFALRQCNPASLYHHYRSLCRKNFEKYIVSGKKPTMKKYLYVFRGLVNALYVAQFKKVPPIRLDRAIAKVALPERIRSELLLLLDRKRHARELDRMEHAGLLCRFVKDFLAHTQVVAARSPTVALLDEWLHTLLL